MDFGSLHKPTVFLIEECANPSTDFFILPILVAGGYPVIRCGHNDVPGRASLSNAIVIFVRYVPSAWVKLIAASRQHLRALIFFMDDDVLDFSASAGMPVSYRYKLAKLALRRRAWLRQQQVRLWVSTPYLVEKYADWRPQLVLPSPTAFPERVRRIFYHGSIATHKAEIRWLRPVMEEVLYKEEQAVFEIIGKKEVFELYRSLPRVTVVHTLKWSAYQAFLAIPGRHVGLNPLLDIPFNRARSYTKFFDITRSGAVGIYTPECACASVVGHGQNGLLVNPDPDAWVAAILSLIQDENYRQTLLRNAEAKMRELTAAAQRNYAGLLDSCQEEGYGSQ
ncbi:MAG: glycosyltransferase [Methylovulum sp.]|uniref:glycosyltransferase n=1 Tax=Methylovulum sp. TaxID=1916980 RepID=UPI00262E684A|nr:glycosyltransferase [Methylovulum sp.]MDD2725547.1 glycosyltransferase [Methylovulum sp.]MDD5126059.1 glycosyltransferase [Methylovulum sp.]